MQNKRKDELEARASIAEQKIRELSLKLENVSTVLFPSFLEGLYYSFCLSNFHFPSLSTLMTFKLGFQSIICYSQKT